MKALTKTDFNFPGQKSVYHGKVRDVYNINGIYIDSISYPVTYRRLRHLEVMADSERKSGKQY